VTHPFRGAVLAGGASSRMGMDKALIEVGGVPLVLRVHHALVTAGATEVQVIGGDRVRLESIGCSVRDDDWPGQGPAAGVVTALAADGPDLVVVLGCDLASPAPEAIRAVVDELATAPHAAVCVPLVGGRRQWHHSAWRASLAEGPMRSAVAAGGRSFDAATRDLEVRTVTGVAPQATADLDTPADLDQLCPDPEP
jgi:molybdenum cofactor guanylyltransferase